MSSERVASGGQEEAVDECISQAKKIWSRIQQGHQRTLDQYRLLGQHLQKAKAHLGHGDFDDWCATTLRLKKSQRCDCMLLAREWEGLEPAKAWARENDDANLCQSLSEAVRLLRSWKRRDREGLGEDNRRRRRAKLCLDDIAEKEQRQARFVFNQWSDERCEKFTANAAEFRLLRWAAHHEVSIQAYLAVFGLNVPAHRKFGTESTDEAAIKLAS